MKFRKNEERNEEKDRRRFVKYRKKRRKIARMKHREIRTHKWVIKTDINQI